MKPGAPTLPIFFADWQQRPEWPAVALANTDPVEDLAPHVSRLRLIVLDFPKFSDGRAYSQARLLRDVHIGNFVEVKKSEIGAGSKANHLSYLGDTKVGKKVNIGAGTVTCNYDGANKWLTTIDDEAFIGSGSMLVAPVRIGKGATIGAGSTVTKDAPDGELTVERSKQVTVPGWKRPVKKPK